MDKNPIPALMVFANWFIRIRWIAIFLLFTSTFIINHFINFSLQYVPIYFLSFFLLVLNFFHFFILKRIIKKESKKVMVLVKRFIHFQIIMDLIVLTFVLHFSGGVENPLILLYFFHMIIASAIFSFLESYLQTAFILLLVGLMAFGECYGVIPHYHIEGLVNPDLYINKFFIYSWGSVYLISSILLVSLTHMIVSRSIKVEESYVMINLALKKKDKLKNEYVLRVTHDIKGHLAAIISCLDVLRNTFIGPLNEMQDEFVNRAYNRTALLINFAKDLLNLTKKRLIKEPEFEEFSLKDLIEKVATSIQLLAKDKSIEFNVFIADDVATIIGNPFTVEELYTNLLFNALKYTPNNGKIELFIRNHPDYIITEITDSGIGIPPEEIPKIFDEFYRASNVPKDINTGSGLGLSIVKQILENHKGEIWAQSEPGVWTKFTFKLPKNPNIYKTEYCQKLNPNESPLHAPSLNLWRKRQAAGYLN